MIRIIKKKKLVKDYKKNIYQLRNSKDVRKNSINKKKIKLSDHEAWFDKMIKNKKFQFNIILFKGLFCGYVNSEKIKNYFYLSWAIKKKFRKKQIAYQALKRITMYKKKKFSAFIFKNNQASIKLVLKNKFKKVYSKKNYYIYQKN